MGYVYLDLVRRYDRLLEQKTACAAVYKAVIRIHRATKLKAADSNGLSDPYVTLKYLFFSFLFFCSFYPQIN